MCDMARQLREYPEMAAIWEREPVAHSSEAQEILHSLLGRARTRVDKIRFRDVRRIYRSITPEVLRTAMMQSTFR